MRNITKYLKKIDESLEILMKNKDFVQNTKKNLATINKLEEEIQKYKSIKVETLELIDHNINEVKKLISDNSNKSNKSG